MKLNLNETWKLCLKMCKWVAENCGGGELVDCLKDQWCIEHNFVGKKQLTNNCFFCNYVREKGRVDCGFCPGRKVDPEFNCCNREYGYSSKPKTFYKKLVQLNKKRVKV